jgi:SlyX protein
MDSERLDDLERHAAHQERMLRELSDVLTEQWRIIETLRRDVQNLKDQLRGVEGAVAELTPPEPPPPHY